MDFFPGGKRGLAVSDPVDGKFRIISTDDGGRSWEVLPDDGMPDSTGEFNFAASGDCLVIAGNHAWFGSGGAASRIFHSTRPRADLGGDRLDDPRRGSGRRLRPGIPEPAPGVAVGGDFAGADTARTRRRTPRAGWRNGGDLKVLAEDAAWASGLGSTS